ncbi:hypothetical protein [Kordia sp.]|uniref:hypothetical protein n=1 Tax=Kordia sp. TaxID=1965332 RepID=UPI003B5C96C0
MKNITPIFFYAKELMILSVLLTIVYIACTVSGVSALLQIVAAKIILTIVFFVTKKSRDHSTLYFLYNLGMSNRFILGILLFLTTVDVLLLQFILN